jgi:glycosyltransferase involved in cell wall biosynthesis
VTGRRTVCYVQGSSEVGGSDVALLRLVQGLDHGAYRPLVVLPADGPLVPLLRSAGAEVAFLPMMQLRSVRSLSYQAAYLFRFWPTVWGLADLLRREGVELVHTNSLYVAYAAWAARLLGIPHVWHVREIPALPRPVRLLAARLAVSLSERVIVMSDAVAVAMARRHPRIEVIPDGIDLAAFDSRRSAPKIREELGIDADAPLVGFVARLDPWKGAHVFVRAAAEVARARPRARFMVCGGELPGHAAYALEVKQLAADLGLDGSLLFTGWTYRLERIPEVMADLDVLVHASVEPEPFGLVLLEAMASSRPVVASRAGGPVEIVDDGSTGLLVPPGDHRELAAAILKLIDDPAWARRLGRAGRLRVEQHYSMPEQVQRIEALYETILPRLVAA